MVRRGNGITARLFSLTKKYSILHQNIYVKIGIAHLIKNRIMVKNLLTWLLVTIMLPAVHVGQKIPVCRENRIAALGKTFGMQKFNETTTRCDPKENREAIRQINSLVKLTGFPLKFIVCKSEKLENAYAAMDSLGDRSIVYDEAFLKKLDSDSLRMETLTVLAHEIGHHLATHTIAIIDEHYQSEQARYCNQSSESFNIKKCTEVNKAYLAQCREQELEADRIAGYIMFKYGATIDQINNMYVQIAWNKDDTHDDHPSLPKRIAAAAAGYQLGVARQDAKVSIAELRGTKYDFIFKKLNVIERNRLREKIRYAVTINPIQEINRNTNYRAFTSGIGFEDTIHQRIKSYLGIQQTNYQIDNETEFFHLHAEACHIQDDPRIKYPLIIGAHIKNNELKIIHFTASAAKVLYKSNVVENEIGFEEITTMITEMYRRGIQKEIDRLYQQ